MSSRKFMESNEVSSKLKFLLRSRWSLLFNCFYPMGSDCQGTLRRFHPFHPFHLFRPLDNFITFPCLCSTSPSLSNTPSFSVDFRVLPLFHFYLTFNFPSLFYSLFFCSLLSYSLFFLSLFWSRVPLFSFLFIV